MTAPVTHEVQTTEVFTISAHKLAQVLGVTYRDHDDISFRVINGTQIQLTVTRIPVMSDWEMKYAATEYGDELPLPNPADPVKHPVRPEELRMTLADPSRRGRLG